MTTTADSGDGTPSRRGRRLAAVPSTAPSTAPGGPVHRAARAYLESVRGDAADTAGAARFPELVLGLVRAPDTDPGVVVEALAGRLATAGYRLRRLPLAAPSPGAPGAPGAPPPGAPSPDGVADALRAVRRIVELREEALRDHGPRPAAWVLDGVRHPGQLQLLGEIYGRRFFAVVCGGMPTGPERRTALDECFGLGDVFLRGDDAAAAGKVVGRFVDCVLGHPFHTPTLDETGMALAFGVSLASASLARRVGAVLMTDGQVVAAGCNEVPKAGGGVYHAESDPDGREFVQGGDASDRVRAEILADTLRRLGDAFGLGLPGGDGADGGAASLLLEALRSDVVRAGKLFDVVEYGRAAHAEIVAIASAARRGAAVQDATLYTTTLPCHECMRAIVAAGIRRVVYAEPYAKSRAADLQADAVALLPRPGEHPGKVAVELFSGIGHRRLADLFSWVPRKRGDQLAGTQDDAGPAGPAGPGTPGVSRTPGAPAAWSPGEAGVRANLSGISGEEELLVQYLREAAALRRLERTGEAPPAQPS